MPWLIISTACFCIICLPSPPPELFVPEVFTFLFTGTPIGLYLLWFKFASDITCGILEMGFNILSLRWVHRTRNSIDSVATANNRRREIKLLIQSFVVGSVFASSSGVLYTIVMGAQINSAMAALAMHCLWTFNHCVNPIIYLLLNSQLRKGFLKLITSEMMLSDLQIIRCCQLASNVVVPVQIVQ